MPKYQDHKPSEVSDVKKNDHRHSVVRLRREPRVDTARVEAYLAPERNAAALPKIQNFRISRLFLSLLVLVFVVAAIVAGYGAWWYRAHVAGAVGKTLQSVIAGAQNLQDMDFQSAANSFGDANRTLATPGASSAMDILRSLGKFMPAIQGIADSFGKLQGLTASAQELALQINQAQNDLPIAFFNGEGEKVLRIISSLKEKLQAIRDGGAALVSAAGRLPEGIFGAQSVPEAFLLETDQYIKDLDNFQHWLTKPEGRRLVILIGNTSELRPGGGFTGSYAEVLVQDGAMKEIKFRDINESDRLLNAKILPPVPVRMIASRFRAADANWFLDFPQSAEKTLQLLERSQLYASSGIKFDGALAITPATISALLEKLGPLKEAGKEYTSENFLTEIQKSVQDGLSSGDKDPKGILRGLLQQIMVKLKDLPQEKVNELVAELPNLAGNKDIQLYLRDESFETFAKSFGLGGEVWQPPSDFSGSYFSLAIANLGGQKTDIVTKTKIRYHALIGEDGKIDTTVSLAREHRGNTRSEWWYREPNIAYIRMYVPANAAVQEVSGLGKPRTTARVFDSTYEKDPQIEAVESTRRDFVALPYLEEFDEYNKVSFGFWQKVDIGQKQESVLDYVHPAPPPAEGRTYTFVIERQAGLSANWNIQISAPVGWHFRENGLPMYELQTDEFPGRFEATLTLTRAE